MSHSHIYPDLSHLKALGRPEGPIPKNVSIMLCLPYDFSFSQPQIIFETFLALLLGILGAIVNAPPLKEISWSSEMKKQSVLGGPNVFNFISDNSLSQIDDMDSRLGFASYVNRGKEMIGRHST